MGREGSFPPGAASISSVDLGGGDMFLQVGTLPDLMKASQVGFSIMYKKQVAWDKRMTFDGDQYEQCWLNLMPKTTKKDDRQKEEATEQKKVLPTTDQKRTQEEEKERDIWCDGINFLLKHDMSDNNKDNKDTPDRRSKTFIEDFKFLLENEMRTNLLNPTDTFTFDSLPQVPPPPPNYNFVNYTLCSETKSVIKKELSV